MNIVDLYPYLRRYSTRWADQSADADDIAQQIALRVLENGSGPDGRCHPSTWAYTATRNEAGQFYRLRQRRTGEPLPLVMASNETPAQLAEAEQMASRVTGILMDVAHGDSMVEIGLQRDIPVNTVKTQIHRARKAFEDAA